MEYKKVYRFTMIDEIKKGKTVYCLDRRMRKIYKTNGLPFGFALSLIDAVAKDEGRFSLWTEEKEEKEND